VGSVQTENSILNKWDQYKMKLAFQPRGTSTKWN